MDRLFIFLLGVGLTLLASSLLNQGVTGPLMPNGILSPAW